MNRLAKNILPVIIPILVVILFVASFIFALTKSGNQNGSSFSGIYGDTVQEKVWWALKDCGFYDEQIAGAMGNIEGESGFRPGLVEGGYTEYNGGIGLCQWTNSPRNGGKGGNTNLRNYAASRGTTWQDADTQVEFLVSYLTGTGLATQYTERVSRKRTYFGHTYEANSWQGFVPTGNLDYDLDYATRAFLANCEGPAQWAANQSIQRRINGAIKYYNEFHGAKRPSASNSVGSATAGYTSSSTPGIKGIYKSSSGKVYTMYVQDIKSAAWYAKDGCFHNSLATCMSAFGSGYTPNKLSGFKYGEGCYGQRSDVSKVGCAWQSISSSKVKEALIKGDPIMFKVVGNNTIVTDNGPTSHREHWLVMMDYKNENGKDRVFIHDPWSTHKDWGWGDLDVINKAIAEWIHIYKK